jgi:hypothetical protein
VAHAELQVLPDRITLVLVEVVADQVDEPDLGMSLRSRIMGGSIGLPMVLGQGSAPA